MTVEFGKVPFDVLERIWARLPATYPDEKMTFCMDMMACEYICPMDWCKLIAADDHTLFHDVYGIRRHLDRQTGQILDCFVPRCAARAA